MVVRNFFRSSFVNGENIGKNVLSARLFLRMTSDKAIGVLRKEITRGKIGKIGVAAYPFSSKGMCPIYYFMFFLPLIFI